MNIISRLFGGRAKSLGAPKPAAAPPTTILGRVQSLARANLYEIFEEAKDPERLADEMFTSYGSAIEEARGAVQQVLTTLKLAEARQASDETEAETWQDRATVAAARAKKLQAKDPTGSATAEKLALTALKKERALRIRVDERSSSIIQQNDIADSLKQGIERMETRYAELQDKRDELVARSRFAAAQSSVAIAVGSVNSEHSSSAISALERTVREKEALAQGHSEIANSGVEAQFRELMNEDADNDSAAKLDSLMGRSTVALEKGAGK
jgi:phage shock protein A